MQDYGEFIAERLAEVPDGPKPLDVSCPRCGAGVGHRCHTHSGYATSTHSGRWKAVGIGKPSHGDRHRDHWDGERRALARKLAALPTLGRE